MKHYVDSLQLERQLRFTQNRSGQLARVAHNRHALASAIAIFVFSIIFAPGSASAVIVPAGTHTFDGNLPGNGFVSFDGTKFVTPLVAPTATFGVSIDSGALHQDYPLSSFHIDSGFSVASAFVFDPPLSSCQCAGFDASSCFPESIECRSSSNSRRTVQKHPETCVFWPKQ